GKALDRAGELFESDAYKKRWPEIDNIVPVEDDATVAKLDTLLDADLQSGVARGKAVMFTPSFRQVDVPNVDAYAFGRLTKNPAKLPYLLFGSWEQFLKKYSKAPSLVTARESPVHLF